jgi:glutathione synthase/RimK-type ligase-like ATP-grasp enzyme
VDSHVLIISTKLDVATDAVIKALGARGVCCTRFNVEDFPFDSHLTSTIDFPSLGLSFSVYPCNLGPVSLDEVTSIWYRRIRSPERPEEMISGVYDFCIREARAALLGSILSYPVRMMSPPRSVWAAENKIFQLATAREVGLLVPPTLVTNEPERVRAAFDSFCGQMIVKPVSSGFVDYGSEQHSIYTSQVLECHLEEIERVRWSPAIYQPLIPKKADVRVTVVGRKFFVAEIDSQSDELAVVDWRRTQNPKLPHQRGTIPALLQGRTEDLLTRLGLSFGAIDFIRTTDDEYVFLEVNPNGQWVWLDDFLGFGITEAVADWLIG